METVLLHYTKKGCLIIMSSFRFFSCYCGEDTTTYGQTYDRDLFRESLEPNDEGGGVDPRFDLEDDD